MPDLTSSEVAALAGITASAVRHAISVGKLRANRNTFGDWRIEPTEAARFIQAQRTNPHGTAAHWRAYREWKAQHIAEMVAA